jgi:RNA polymerase-binding transcription factor DksA
MLERLVKPILDIYNEMEILQMEGRKKDEALEALAKEYEKKEARLQNEKDKIYTKVHQLGDKQTKLRKELGVSMRKAKCPMTTTEIDGVLYGICDNCGVAIIQQMTDTKEAEKLLAIDRLEKSK